MYVSEICTEGILVSFPWWLKKVKSRSKNSPFFQMSPILKLNFKKKKQKTKQTKKQKTEQTNKQLHFSEENYLI